MERRSVSDCSPTWPASAEKLHNEVAVRIGDDLSSTYKRSRAVMPKGSFIVTTILAYLRRPMSLKALTGLKNTTCVGVLDVSLQPTAPAPPTAAPTSLLSRSTHACQSHSWMRSSASRSQLNSTARHLPNWKRFALQQQRDVLFCAIRSVIYS